MSNKFHDITFTESVKQAQENYGSRRHYAKSEGGGEQNTTLSDAEIDFIENADGFYMARSASKISRIFSFAAAKKVF